MNKNIKIENCRISQINEVVKIHLNELYFGIYGMMGMSFLQRYYLKSIIDGNKIFVAMQKKKIIGILELRASKSKIQLITTDYFLLLKIIFSKPRYLYLIIMRVFFQKNNPGNEISNIAVLKKHQSSGVGSMLIAEAIKVAKKEGVSLFTYTHNERLANFYCHKYNADIIEKKNLLVYFSFLCVIH